MISICEEFGLHYGMSYNSTKTVCIAFSREKVQPNQDILLNGNRIKWCEKVLYLGNWLTPTLDDSHDISIKRGQFYGSVNNLFSNFKQLPCDILSELFVTFCTSFYGSQCWSLRNTELTKLYSAYNKCLRRVWNLPYDSHRYIIHLLMGKGDLQRQLSTRFLKMLDTMYNAENRILSFVAQRANRDMSCQLGSNYSYVCMRNSSVNCFNLDNLKDLYKNTKNKTDYTDAEHCLANVIRELREVSNGCATLNMLNMDDIECIITDISKM
jgi:hypothetical protein